MRHTKYDWLSQQQLLLFRLLVFSALLE